MRPSPPSTALNGALSVKRHMARGRLALIVLLLLMGYLAASLRLADLTLLKHPSDSASGAPSLSARTLRADITDRNGALLATSLRTASVYADTAVVEDAGRLARDLTRILPDENEKNLRDKLSSGKRFIWIARNITPRQEYAINALGDPALNFTDEDRRIYPHGNLAAHITGYTDVDGRGIAGIEKSFDVQLKAGESPLRLTIDLRVQHILRREIETAVKKFQAKAGIGLIMDVRSGDLIAMASLPDFNPNAAARATDDQKFNRATLGVFEMGSTFKLFPVAAALESGKVRISDNFDATQAITIGRFRISDFHAKKRVLSVPEIFMYSSNIGTARIAQRLGNAGMQDFYKALGFSEPAPLELPERGAPLYPHPWRDVTTLTASFGHGIAVSPLHLIRGAAALVNGGILPTPTLILSDKSESAEGLRIVTEETSRHIRELLELVVTDGTGSQAKADGYNVGGKTGTAEKNAGGHYNKEALLSSFLGVFPIDDPRYAVLVMIDEPKGTKETFGYATGGWTAAPVVSRVVAQMAPLYQMRPDMTRTARVIEHSLGLYVKELREGKKIAADGTDR